MDHVFIISTPDKDRANSRVNINGWELDRFKRNPIVLWSEKPLLAPDNIDDAIGYSPDIWIEANKLYATWRPDPYSPIADKINKKLINGGTLAASVNFIPIDKPRYGNGDEAKGGKNETLYYSRQELLSWKICMIPSNSYCVYQPKYDYNYNKDKRMRMRLLELQAKHYGLFDA